MPLIRAPLLVIHSREDTLIPFKHGQAIFDAAREPKTFLEIRGDHDMGFVETIADRVTVLHQGQVLAEGSLREVQANEQVIEVYLGR